MNNLSLEIDSSIARYTLGDLVYAAGELLILTSAVGRAETALFSDAQLGLVVSITPGALVLWFAEFGVNKEREHIFACAPLDQPTTKIWATNSAICAEGSKDFLNS